MLARARGASLAELGVMFAITSAGGVAGAFASPSLVRRFSPRANSAAIQLASLATPAGPLIAGAPLAALGAPHTVLVYAAWLIALAIGATVNRGVRQDVAAAAQT